MYICCHINLLRAFCLGEHQIAPLFSKSGMHFCLFSYWLVVYFYFVHRWLWQIRGLVTETKYHYFIKQNVIKNCSLHLYCKFCVKYQAKMFQYMCFIINHCGFQRFQAKVLTSSLELLWQILPTHRQVHQQIVNFVSFLLIGGRFWKQKYLQ